MMNQVINQTLQAVIHHHAPLLTVIHTNLQANPNKIKERKRRQKKNTKEQNKLNMKEKSILYLNIIMMSNVSKASKITILSMMIKFLMILEFSLSKKLDLNKSKEF
jgi:hypothetical protein